jgi:two-component system response regulator PilR (NtrC family)
VRVVAATNRNLDAMVAEGTFREDLYYRLNVIPVEVPRLRERAEDIDLLAAHFAKKYALAANKAIRSIDPDSLDRLRNFDWPGNVRQLENVIERAVAMETTDILRVELNPGRRAAAAAAGAESVLPTSFAVPTAGVDMERYVADMERQILVSALKQANGVQVRAAELLKLSYRSFRHLMKKYDL